MTGIAELTNAIAQLVEARGRLESARDLQLGPAALTTVEGRIRTRVRAIGTALAAWETPEPPPPPPPDPPVTAEEDAGNAHARAEKARRAAATTKPARKATSRGRRSKR